MITPLAACESSNADSPGGYHDAHAGMGPPAEVAAELADAERLWAATTVPRALSARLPRSGDGQEHQSNVAKRNGSSSHREARDSTLSAGNGAESVNELSEV